VTSEIELGGISVEIVQKDIKNIHLSVNPPSGKVRISAPLRMSIHNIRAFALSKLSWIKTQQQKLQLQEREFPREFLERESHYLWGKRYLLTIVDCEGSPSITTDHDKLILNVNSTMSSEQIQELVNEWYRDQIRKEAPLIIEKWASILGVSVNKLFVQRMKTKWGTCNPDTKGIRLNSELAKKPLEYLEYVILHEMAHLLEPTHNEKFFRLLDHCIPNWRHIRDELNRLPVPHGEWS
jgi:predicted metal-dependent hydrolase